MTLLIPGPVDVQKCYLEAMTKPMIGHRSKDYQALHQDVVASIQELLDTKNHVFLMTCSATGAMEAAVRNTVNKNVLCLANGAFGRRWHEIAMSCGKNATLVDFGDGQPYTLKQVKNALATRHYDALTVVINETATGMENHLTGIKSLLKKYPDTLLLADGVTAAFGTAIDLAGIDVLVFGTQKALSLPPGLAISIANDAAIKRSKHIKNKGYYFDYERYAQHAATNHTPTTPNIPLLQALQARLHDLQRSGLQRVIQEHEARATQTRAYITTLGLAPYITDAYASKTVTTITNTLDLDMPQLQAAMQQQGFTLANGYGDLKDKTFRIGHMGLDLPTTKRALAALATCVQASQPKSI